MPARSCSRCVGLPGGWQPASAGKTAHATRPFSPTPTPTQLEQHSTRQQQLELEYRPTVQRLPALLQQLKPEELSQAAEFAALEGMRGPLLQVSA